MRVVAHPYPPELTHKVLKTDLTGSINHRSFWKFLKLTMLGQARLEFAEVVHSECVFQMKPRLRFATVPSASYCPYLPKQIKNKQVNKPKQTKEPRT